MRVERAQLERYSVVLPQPERVHGRQPRLLVHARVPCVQEYSQGSLVTHHFSNRGRSKHTNSMYLSISIIKFYKNNTDATFGNVYFIQGQYTMCIHIGPYKVLACVEAV